MASDQVAKLKEQMRAEGNTENIKTLILFIQKTCFKKCVTAPGSSTSSSERTCMTQCTEKYVKAWDHVNSAVRVKLREKAVI